MKNKKLTTLSVALGLSAITLISGISAYFTDADTATNEFTIGKVSLDLQEPNWIPPSNITPNQVIQKDPQIKNDGINDEFVFLTVKVPIKNIATAELDGTKLPATKTELFTYTINENWTQIGNEIKTTGFVTRIYAYAKDNQCIALKKGETTNPLFDTVKVCNAIEDQGLELTKEQIVINAYGIQTNDINDANGIDKTSPMDVWEVINNQRNVGLKPEENRVTMIRGYDFNESLNKNFSTATSVKFVKNRKIPENVNPIDFSVKKDKSILGWQEGVTLYVNSQDRIMANSDCNLMFSVCTKLKEIDFSNFDTSHVTGMKWMFKYCRNLTEIKGLENFDTSKVTNMELMFDRCQLLTSLNVSNFNTSNVTKMSSMFSGCNNLTELNVSNFNTFNVTNMSSMFSGCNNLTELNLSNFDTSNVDNMNLMFDGCKKLRKLDVSSFNTSKVTEMGWMFRNCNFTTLDLSNFNTSKVILMSGMFSGCKNMTELNLSSFDTAKVTNMDYMFNNCSNLTTLKVSATDWVINQDTDITDMWLDCPIQEPTHKI